MTDKTTTDQPRRHTAGLFDIRTIIGALLTLYGIVLLVVGLTGNGHMAARGRGGDDANTWTGVGLLVVGVLMVLWAVLRPIVVDEAELAEDKRAAQQESTPGGAA